MVSIFTAKSIYRIITLFRFYSNQIRQRTSNRSFLLFKTSQSLLHPQLRAPTSTHNPVEPYFPSKPPTKVLSRLPQTSHPLKMQTTVKTTTFSVPSKTQTTAASSPAVALQRMLFPTNQPLPLPPKVQALFLNYSKNPFQYHSPAMQ